MSYRDEEHAAAERLARLEAELAELPPDEASGLEAEVARLEARRDELVVVTPGDQLTSAKTPAAAKVAITVACVVAVGSLVVPSDLAPFLLLPLAVTAVATIVSGYELFALVRAHLRREVGPS